MAEVDQQSKTQPKKLDRQELIRRVADQVWKLWREDSRRDRERRSKRMRR